MRHILEGFDWAALGKGHIVDVNLSLQRPLLSTFLLFPISPPLPSLVLSRPTILYSPIGPPNTTNQTSHPDFNPSTESCKRIQIDNPHSRSSYLGERLNRRSRHPPSPNTTPTLHITVQDLPRDPSPASPLSSHPPDSHRIPPSASNPTTSSPPQTFQHRRRLLPPPESSMSGH